MQGCSRDSKSYGVRCYKGSYILEMGMVLTGFVFFVLGATDIAAIFQARSAARTAVQEGLRCLYPTDAGCSAFTPGAYTPARYDVWVTAPGYYIQREHVSASARWPVQPLIRLSLQKAPIEEITVTTPQRRYETAQASYPFIAFAAYSVPTSDLPTVTGDDALNPTFVDSSNKRASPRIKLPLKNVTSATERGRGDDVDGYPNPNLEIGRTQAFTIGDKAVTNHITNQQLFEAIRSGVVRPECYSSQGSRNIDWDNEDAKCFHHDKPLMDKNHELEIPIILRISGSVGGTSSNGRGKLEVVLDYLRNEDGKGMKVYHSRPLGGRVFDSGSSGNLVPRGIDLTDVSPPLRGRDDRNCESGKFCNYTAEIEAHHTIHVPADPDVSIRLRFFLSSSNGERVQWNGEAVEVYFPTFDLRQAERDCGYSSTSGNCSAIVAPMPVHAVVPDTSKRAQLTTLHSLCSWQKPNDLQEDPRSFAESARANAMGGAISTPVVFSMDAGACDDDIKTYTCPPDATESRYSGCDSAVSEEERNKLLSRCGVPLPLPDVSKVETKAGGPAQEAGSTVVEGCPEGAIPGCTVGSEIGRVPWQPVNGATCSKTSIEIPPEMTEGPVDINACAAKDSFSEAVEARYRNREAIPMGVPVATASYTSERFTFDHPGACAKWRPAPEEEGPKLCGKGVSRVMADRCCERAEGRCNVVQVQSTAAEAEHHSAVISAAIDRAEGTVRTIYPAAEISEKCDGANANCATISAGFTDGDRRVWVSAQLHVPLRLLSFINSQLATVEHAEERILEQTLLE